MTAGQGEARWNRFQRKAIGGRPAGADGFAVRIADVSVFVKGIRLMQAPAFRTAVGLALISARLFGAETADGRSAGALFNRAGALFVPRLSVTNAAGAANIVTQGFFARDFEIPEGDIWQAVLDVNNMTVLHINGREVADASPVLPRPVTANFDLYRSRLVNIKPYLKPGRNRFCLSGYRSFVWACGSVIMASGERRLLDSDATWRWHSRPPENWNAPDYNIADWDVVPTVKSSDQTQAYAAPLTSYGFEYKFAGDRPGYDGYMVLRNPDGDQLFYQAARRHVRLEIEIPGGFQARKPQIAWTIEKYAGGKTQPVLTGRLVRCAPRGSGLAFALDLGGLPAGIYVFAPRLFLDGALIETRLPEPLAVFAPLDMPEAPGDFYEQGMDLELEDTIDFTRPDDPAHPWMETDAIGPYPRPHAPWTDEFVKPPLPAIVAERNGLKYRETRPRYEAQFSYKISFKHPGDFYLMVLEYPDDQERWFGVSCNTAMRMHNRGSNQHRSDWAVNKCGPSIWTGGKYPLSGAMREMKWLYRPDPGFHAINVIALGKDMAGAAARLRIYRVAGRLPALRIDSPGGEERRIGLLSERTWLTAGFTATFGCWREGMVKNLGFGLQSARPDYDPVLQACAILEEYLETCEAYTQYLRFTGQNLHVMGCYQYSDSHTAYFPRGLDARIDFDIRDVAAQVFQANGIAFLASVEFTDTTGLRRKAAAEQQRAGLARNPFCFVNKDGDQAIDTGSGTGAAENWNFIHPEVEAAMLGIVDDLALKFKRQPNFLGMNWTAYFGGGWIPTFRTVGGPLDSGYDDATISAFERDTQTRVPVDGADPGKFRKRFEFLTSPAMLAAWTDWRARRLHGFYAKAAARLKRHRPDLACSAGCYTGVDHFREWKKSGRPFLEYLSGWGWNPQLFRDDGALWFTLWLPAAGRYEPAFKQKEYACAWMANASPEVYAAVDLGAHRSVMLTYGWLEIERVAAQMPWRADWPRPYQSTMEVQQGGDFAREPYAQAMVGLDPNLVMFGFTDANMLVGQEQQLRDFTRVYRALPAARFHPVNQTGFHSNLAIRELRQNGQLYFYAVNPGYWPIKGRIAIAGAAHVAGLVSGDIIKGSDASGAIAVPVELGPFGMAAFQAPAARQAQPVVSGWTNEPVAAADLAHLRRILADAEKTAAMPGMDTLLGRAKDGHLRNSIGEAARALDAGEYARAWGLLTDAEFWTIVYQTSREMQNAGFTRSKSMRLAKTAAAPRLDGKLDDPAWAGLKPLEDFVTPDRTPAPYATLVYACHDGENVYVAFDCRDSDPQAIRQAARDEPDIYALLDDAVAVFIRPGLDQPHYYQLAANAAGALFDQQCTVQGARNYDYHPGWEVRGAVNARGWILEMKIPAAALNAGIQAGDSWGVNFHRKFRNDQYPPASWNYNDNWHDVARLGLMEME